MGTQASRLRKATESMKEGKAMIKRKHNKTNYTKETLINCLCGRIAALRGTRNLDYPFDMSRFLRSVRLTLHPAQTINQGFPNGIMPHIAIALIAALALLLAPMTASAQAPVVVFTTIDLPDSMLLNDINDYGQIAASNNGIASRSFLYDIYNRTGVEIVHPNAGVVVDFGGTRVNGINNSGQMGGYYFNFSYGRGFLYDNGSFTNIVFPGAVQAYVQGINDLGQAVGYFVDSNGCNRGFLYDGNSYSVINHPNAVCGSLYGTMISDINNSGLIAGSFTGSTGQSYGFLYDGDSYTLIDPPGAGNSSNGFYGSGAMVYGINDHGQAVGNFIDNDDVTHGFIYDISDDSYTVLDIPGSTYTYLSGINNLGQIVGYYSDGAKNHGVLLEFITDTGDPYISISPMTRIGRGQSLTLPVTALNTDFTLSVSPASGSGCVKSGYNVICTPTATGEYEITVTATADPTKTAMASVSVVEPTISITSTSVIAGNSATFSVNAQYTDILWPSAQEVQGIFQIRYNIQVVYIPPAVAGLYEFTVRAAADPTITATATIFVTDVNPALPSSVSLESCQFPVPDGCQFHIVAGSSVSLNFNAQNTAFLWPMEGEVAGSYTIWGNQVNYAPPAVAGDYEFTVRAAADPTQKATAIVTVVEAAAPGQAAIDIFQAAPSIIAGQSVGIRVIAQNTAVVWPSIEGSFSTVGFSQGIQTLYYTPPPVAGTYDFTVTAAADPTKTATAQITVVSVNPPFEHFLQKIAQYASSTTNVDIEVDQGFTVTQPVTIPANLYGKTLTIRSASPANRVILTRDVSGNLFTVSGGAKLILQDIIIDGNYIIDDYYTGYTLSGSLVYVSAGGDFTMNDGAVLRNNHSSQGGGVSVLSFYDTFGTFNMTGGKITNNTANYYGGGVYLSSGRFNMTGGEISGNTANYYGGGVYAYASSVTTGGSVFQLPSALTLGGDAVVRDNSGGNVYLNQNINYLDGSIFGSFITLGDGPYGNGIAAPAPGMEIWVTKGTPSNDNVIVESGAYPGDEAYFFADEPGMIVVYDAGRLVIARQGPNVLFPLDQMPNFEIEVFDDMGVLRGVITKSVLATIDQMEVDDPRGDTGRHYVAYPLTEIIARLGIVSDFKFATGEAVDAYYAIGAIDDAYIAVAHGYDDYFMSSDSNYPRFIVPSGHGFWPGDPTERVPVVSLLITITLTRQYPNDFTSLQSAISGYATSTEDVYITVTADFDATSTLYIPENPYGKALTIRSVGARRTITRGHYGEVFYVTPGAKLVLENIFIDGNKDIYRNSGLLVYVNGGELVMNNDAVLRNSSSYAVNVFYGIFNMSGGEISGNIRGVGVDTNSEFTMTGGEISGNTASGVTVSDNSAFTMTGGKISGNIGGGVGVYRSAFTMRGGEITGNIANQVGGVLVWSSEFTMTGGKISGNIGGGVSVESYDSESTLTLGGTAVISGNTKNNVYIPTQWFCIDNDCNNGLYPVYHYIKLSTDIPPTPGMKVGIHTDDSDMNIVESGAIPNYAQYFYADDSGKAVVFESDDKLAVIGTDRRIVASPTPIQFGAPQAPYARPAAQLVTITNNSPDTVALNQPTATNYEIGGLSRNTLIPGATATFTVRPWPDLSIGSYDETIDIIGDGGISAKVFARFAVLTEPEQMTVSSFAELQEAISYYYRTATGNLTIILTNGFYLPEQLDINNAGGATLTITSADAANPVTLTRDYEYDMFSVRSGAKLVLGNIVIDGNKEIYSYGRGRLLYVDGGDFTMNNGAVLTNNHGENAVYVWYGTFTMTGGEITGNTSNGSGVYVYNSVFTMTGGEITDNAGDWRGGVHIAYSCEFSVGGTAVISGNTPNNVYLEYGQYITIGTGDDAPVPGLMNVGVRTASWDGVIGEYCANASYTQHFFADEPGKVVTCQNNQLVIADNYPAAVLSVNNTKAAPERTAKVEIKLDNNPGLMALQLSVEYDAEKLELLPTYEAGDILTVPFAPWDINANPILFYFENAALEDNYQDGTLITLKFRTKSEGYAPVTLVSASAFNLNEQRIDVMFSDGGVTIAPIIYGDANGDEEVDIADVLRLRRFLAGHPFEIDELAADANGDEEVDMADVLRLRRYLAGHPVILGPQQTQQLAFQMSAFQALAANEVKVSASHETAAPGEYIDVVVSLDENPGMLALQLRLGYDATVMEAVSITPGSLIPIPVQPPLSVNPLPLNFEGATFDDIVGAGILATVRFRILDDAEPGLVDITLDGIYAGNALEDSFTVSTFDGSVYVIPDVVSLTGIAVTTLPTTKVYTEGDALDLAGMVVTATYSDGNTANVTALVSTNPANGAALDVVGTQPVAVSYTEDGVTKTLPVGFTVEVKAVETAVPILEIVSFEMIGTTRVGLTQYDYEVRAYAKNIGDAYVENATAVLVGYPSNTTVIRDGLTFGAIPVGATAPSEDTFIIRLDRTSTFDEALLDFTFDYAPR